MDARVKLFYWHLSAVLPTLEAPQLPIHNEGWTVWSGDIKLPSPSRECLHAAIQDPITQLYWIQHKRFSFDAQLAIDWDTCATGMQALQPARRRWIAKHASSNCGVGTTLVKWNTKTMTDALGVEFPKTPPMCFGARLKVPMKCGMKALSS